MAEDKIANVAELAIISMLIVCVLAMPKGEKFLLLLRELIKRFLKRYGDPTNDLKAPVKTG